MLELLLQTDKNLFLYLNSLNNNTYDFIMLQLSHNYIFMAILVISLLVLSFKYYPKKKIKIFALLLLTFASSDMISTKVFKDGFKRPRPCHETSIKEQVHLAGRYCGGKYGFFSSHASNSFAIISFFYFLLKRFSSKFILLFLYSLFVGYSRIYLGKHYPLDIACGGLFGILLGYLWSYKVKIVPE